MPPLLTGKKRNMRLLGIIGMVDALIVPVLLVRVLLFGSIHGLVQATYLLIALDVFGFTEAMNSIVNANIHLAHPRKDIGGEFKNRASTLRQEAQNHAPFYNSPPISRLSQFDSSCLLPLR